jgi:hypothetical protein
MLLQLDSKEDIVEIDAHVELSRTEHWLFILKRDPVLRAGDARKEVCFVLVKQYRQFGIEV